MGGKKKSFLSNYHRLGVTNADRPFFVIYAEYYSAYSEGERYLLPFHLVVSGVYLRWLVLAVLLDVVEAQREDF
jgi:hypothetical protein